MDKVLTHLSKTNAFYRRPSVISKHIFFVDSQPPSPPFQYCNTLHGFIHLVTTLKRGEYTCQLFLRYTGRREIFILVGCLKTT